MRWALFLLSTIGCVAAGLPDEAPPLPPAPSSVTVTEPLPTVTPTQPTIAPPSATAAPKESVPLAWALQSSLLPLKEVEPAVKPTFNLLISARRTDQRALFLTQNSFSLQRFIGSVDAERLPWRVGPAGELGVVLHLRLPLSSGTMEFKQGVVLGPNERLASSGVDLAWVTGGKSVSLAAPGQRRAQWVVRRADLPMTGFLLKAYEACRAELEEVLTPGQWRELLQESGDFVLGQEVIVKS